MEHRRIVFVLLAFLFCILSFGQNTKITVDRLEVKQSMKLGSNTVTSISRDSSFGDPTHLQIPTSTAVKKYVDGVQKRDTSIAVTVDYNLGSAVGVDKLRRLYRKVTVSLAGTGNKRVLTLPDGDADMADLEIIVAATEDTIQVQATGNDAIAKNFRKVPMNGTGLYKCVITGAQFVWRGGIFDRLIVDADLADSTITPLKLNATWATGGQVLKYNSGTGLVGWAQDSSIYRGSGTLRSENTYVQMAADGTQNLGIGQFPSFPNVGLSGQQEYGLYISPDYWESVALRWGKPGETKSKVDLTGSGIFIESRNFSNSGNSNVTYTPGKMIFNIEASDNVDKRWVITIDSSKFEIARNIAGALTQYNLLPANQAPSTTSAVKQTLVWTGTGAASTVAFENVSSGGGSTHERVFLEGSTAASVDLDAGTTVKDVDGTNTTFTFPTNLADLHVYKNGMLIAQTGSLTTRDYSCNTGTNTITFTVALVSTDRVIIEK